MFKLGWGSERLLDSSQVWDPGLSMLLASILDRIKGPEYIEGTLVPRFPCMSQYLPDVGGQEGQSCPASLLVIILFA